MAFSGLSSHVRLPIAVVLAGVFISSCPGQSSQQSSLPSSAAAAQSSRGQTASPDASVLKDYSKPYPHHPNPIAPYEAHHVDPPNLANGPRLESLIKDGRLQLSMDDAIALTLENNLDLAIARYNSDIADTDILRAEGGASTLGVNSGIVQNTPGGTPTGLGGTVGSGSGGTNPGSAGAATGTNGLVSSTLGIGSTIVSFDPILSGTLQMDRQSQSFHQRAERHFCAKHQHRAPPTLTTHRDLQWGTDVSVTFNNSHITTNSSQQLLQSCRSAIVPYSS